VFQNEFGVLGAPFLASGYDGIRKVVTSDMFEEWVQTLADGSGLQVLSFNWWQGERHLLTNKEINTPADLSGIRMRTPGAPVWTGTVAAMGATPTPMPWAEVYSAL
jgi:TRAP-type C4-dicarboxylate transport system substrate-binding protein